MPLRFRAALGYEKFDIEDIVPGQEGDGKILSGIGNVMVTFPLGPARPYVTAGLGAFHVKRRVEGSGTTTRSSETKFGIDAGAGVEFRIGVLKGFVEGRVENAFTDDGFNPALAGGGSTTIVPVTFGLIF